MRSTGSAANELWRKSSRCAELTDRGCPLRAGESGLRRNSNVALFLMAPQVPVFSLAHLACDAAVGTISASLAP